MNKPQDFREMTANTIGVDLLQCFITEMKLLPKPWESLAEDKQNDVINRVRSRIEHNVNMAVHLIASKGRKVVTGSLDQITIKDGVKAVIKFGVNQPLHDIYESQSKAVLVIVKDDADEYTAAMDTIKGEADQRALDLGHEYKPNSDGEGMEDDIIEGDFKAIPKLEFTEEELADASIKGYKAASQGRSQSECPIMPGELCIEWVKGWKQFHAARKSRFFGMGLFAAKNEQPVDAFNPDCFAGYDDVDLSDEERETLRAEWVRGWHRWHEENDAA